MRLFVGLIAVFASACFVDFPVIRGDAAMCTPGDNVFCRCPGGSPGTRACNTDGTGFGVCVTAPDVACGESEMPPMPPPDPPSNKGDEPPGTGGGAPGAGGGGPVGNCGTVDYQGECTGALLSWCNDGELVETDCAATDRVCEHVDDTIGYDCVVPPDPCEGLTLEGECVGNLLRYCSSEQIVEVDCAAQSLLCGFDTTYDFYDCVDPPPP